MARKMGWRRRWRMKSFLLWVRSRLPSHLLRVVGVGAVRTIVAILR
jgi:hypothetical protein